MDGFGCYTDRTNKLEITNTIIQRAMEKGRLLEVVKQHSDRDAIGMIMSNYADYGHTEKGAMISVGQFYKIADVLIEWAGQKKLEITAPELCQNVRHCFSFARYLNGYYEYHDNTNGGDEYKHVVNHTVKNEQQIYDEWLLLNNA